MQHINTTTKGVGLAGGGIGVGAAKTQGSAQSASSINAQPPQRRSEAGYVWAIILGFIGILAIGNAFGWMMLLVAGVAGYVAYQNGLWNKQHFPGLLQRWENTFRCSRCEHWYVLAADRR